MNALEVLRTAKAKIEDPAHWTQLVYAKDAQGRAVSAQSHTAVCWCARGVLISLSDLRPVGSRSVLDASGDTWRLVHKYLRRALDALYGPDVGLVSVNDNYGHAAVMNVYDRAIGLAELAQAEGN
jgi:hypothetical protein